MLLVVCFLYSFFAVVLGLYLGLELISVRKADRMARTLFRAAVQSARAEAAPTIADSVTPSSAEANYFQTR